MAIIKLIDAWIRDYYPKVIKRLDDIPFISNVYDRDYAAIYMLAAGSRLNPSQPTAGVEEVEDLDAGHGEALAFAVESSSGLENESPANQELPMKKLLSLPTGSPSSSVSSTRCPRLGTRTLGLR